MSLSFSYFCRNALFGRRHSCHKGPPARPPQTAALSDSSPLPRCQNSQQHNNNNNNNNNSSSSSSTRTTTTKAGNAQATPAALYPSFSYQLAVRSLRIRSHTARKLARWLRQTAPPLLALSRWRRQRRRCRSFSRGCLLARCRQPPMQSPGLTAAGPASLSDCACLPPLSLLFSRMRERAGERASENGDGGGGSGSGGGSKVCVFHRCSEPELSLSLSLSLSLLSRSPCTTLAKRNSGPNINSLIYSAISVIIVACYNRLNL